MADLAERQIEADPPRGGQAPHKAILVSRAVVALRNTLPLLAPALVFCVLLLALWEGMARITASPLVPGVGEIVGEIRRIVRSGLAFQQIGITLGRILLGFATAFVLSLVVGIASARNIIVRRFFDPAIILGLTVPGLVWALLCVIWFGVSLATPVVSIALGVLPALVLHVIQGMHAVDAEIIEMSHVFKLPIRDKLLHIWIPSLVPYLISGSRVGLSLAWKVIVLVELFGLSNGVGYQLNSEFSSQNVAGVLAWTIVFWVIMIAIEYGLLQTLERRATVWRRTTKL